MIKSLVFTNKLCPDAIRAGQQDREKVSYGCWQYEIRSIIIRLESRLNGGSKGEARGRVRELNRVEQTLLTGG